MRHDRLDEAHAVARVGARQRDEVFHRGVRDELAVLDVLLDGVGQRRAPDPRRRDTQLTLRSKRRASASSAKLVVVVQRAQQPALLERAVGRVGVQQLPKDQRLGLRHLPHDGGRPCRAADDGGSGRVCGRPRPRTRRPPSRPRSAFADRRPPTTPRGAVPAPAAAPAAAHTAHRADEIPTPRSVRPMGLLWHSPIASCTGSGGSRPRSPSEPVT